MKEFTFITTVKIAKNVAELYPNYYINGFTPKSVKKILDDLNKWGYKNEYRL